MKENTVSRKLLALGAVLLFLLTLVFYIPAIRGGYIWDDDLILTNNLTLRTVDGLRGIWSEMAGSSQYYPLVFTTFWVEYHIWQLDPLGYHLVNVILHALNAIFLWFILRHLSIPGAWFAATVFALHPVHVESVAWITERKNVLSGFFYLSAMLVYLRFLRLDVTPSSAPPPSTLNSTPSSTTRYHWVLYSLALGLYLCALLSKSITCSMPAAILLLWWWKRGSINWRTALPLLPFFLSGAVLGMVTAWNEKKLVYIEGQEEWAFSFIERCLIAGRALWFYASKLFWPFKLTFVYPRWQIDAEVWWQYLYPLTAIAVLIGLWLLRKKIGKAPLTAVLFFACTLVPALGFFDIYPMRYSLVADHFQYLASIGLIVLSTAFFTLIFRKLSLLFRATGCTACGGVIVILGMLVWHQGHIYADLETLWRDTLSKNPTAWMAHNNLGNLLLEQGKIDEAILKLEQAVLIRPNDGLLHDNLARGYSQKGMLDEAISEHKKALSIDPNDAVAHQNLGSVYGKKQMFDESISEFKKAIVLKPNYTLAHFNLGIAYSKKGMHDEAITAYKKALEIAPNFAEAHHSLGVAYSKKGDLNAALIEYEKAQAVNPRFLQAHISLGNAYIAKGELANAISSYEKALELNPGHAMVYYNLGIAYQRKGELDKAISRYKKALELNPDYTKAHYKLGSIYLDKGMLDDAISEYKKTLELNPLHVKAQYNLGVVYYKKGDENNAITHFKKALDIKPDYAPAYQSLISLLRKKEL